MAGVIETVERRGIPERYLAEVIDGVEMDLEPRRYPTFQDLHGYCYRVASAVGLCCLHVWGFRSESGRAERLAEDCGLALQLTNIIRDVGEDAARAESTCPTKTSTASAWCAKSCGASASATVCASCLPSKRIGRGGFMTRPRNCFLMSIRSADRFLGAIVGVYRALLDEIERRDFDVLAGRVSLSKRRKGGIALGSLFFDRWFWKRHRGPEKAPGLS